MSGRCSSAAIVCALWMATLGGCAHEHLLLDRPSHIPSRIELTHVPFFPQERYQCGPAALATALGSSDVSVTAQELTPEVYLPARRGSLQIELLAAARKRDRIPYTLAPNLPALMTEVAAGRPVVVMQNLGWRILPIWHFAVVVGYDLDAGTLLLRSGTVERLSVDTAAFARSWRRAKHWAVVLLKPGEIPDRADERRYLTAVASLEAVGRRDAAQRSYAAALQRWPLSAWPHLGLANIHLAKGDASAAEQAYALALRSDPDNVVALNNAAELLAARGCVERARVYISRAATLAQNTTLQSSVQATAQQIERLALSPTHCLQ